MIADARQFKPKALMGCVGEGPPITLADFDKVAEMMDKTEPEPITHWLADCKCGARFAAEALPAKCPMCGNMIP